MSDEMMNNGQQPMEPAQGGSCTGEHKEGEMKKEDTKCEGKKEEGASCKSDAAPAHTDGAAM